MIFYTPFSMTIDHCATKCYLQCFCQNEFGNNYCSSVYGLEFPEITDFITGCRVSKCLRKHPNFFPFFRQNLAGWTQIDCDIDLEVESVGAHSSTINMGWNHFWRRIFSSHYLFTIYLLKLCKTYEEKSHKNATKSMMSRNTTKKSFRHLTIF